MAYVISCHKYLCVICDVNVCWHIWQNIQTHNSSLKLTRVPHDKLATGKKQQNVNGFYRSVVLCSKVVPHNAISSFHPRKKYQISILIRYFLYFFSYLAGVSCDACLKGNFRGRRYKCLICYDYDLCAACYEEGATSTSHSVEHPMQCILTRADFEIYYGGEPSNSEQPQSFTCPYCKKMGFSDTGLYDHVSAEHTDTGLEVVCPVCAAHPGGDPNLVTDDFSGHLTLEHRTGPRDLISFLDEPSAIRHGGVRRMPHTGRALGGPRPRRSNMHLSSSSGLSALSPSGRESVDPIAELLSQLSGVRRGNPPPSQLQQLQMQIQLERQQVSVSCTYYTYVSINVSQKLEHMICCQHNNT